MTAEQYRKWTKPFRAHPLLTKGLLLTNQILTIVCYILFPLLIFLQWMDKSGLWWRTLLTAGVSFSLVSLFRKLYNKKRPYEALDIKPLIQKKKAGQSFPSRHVFSVFVIAMCWFYYVPAVGVALFLIGGVMAWIRVIGGVHYPIDVLSGTAIGIISGMIGLFLI